MAVNMGAGSISNHWVCISIYHIYTPLIITYIVSIYLYFSLLQNILVVPWIQILVYLILLYMQGKAYSIIIFSNTAKITTDINH